MKKKTHEEIEHIAFTALRKDADKKLLSNTSVTCYVRGFEKAQDEAFKTFVDIKNIIEHALDQIDEAQATIIERAGYSGRGYTDEEDIELLLISETSTALYNIVNGEEMKKLTDLRNKKKL